MDVPTGALHSLLLKLRELLKENYKQQYGVKERIRYLTQELDDIQFALQKVSEVPPDMLDEQERNWAREIREASYNIEDLMDTFLVRVDGYHEPIEETGCWCLERAKKKMGEMPSKGRARADIATATEDMMKQLQEIAERRDRGYRVDDILIRPVTSTSSTVDPRLPALYRNEWELVGIEEAKEELVRMLTQGDAADDNKGRCKVVSIVGLAGVGKTTLAKAVYNWLQAQFDCSAFVSVSRNPDLKKVFMDILHELDEAKYHIAVTAKRDMDQLIDEIRSFLENKRYFIVIDDIWEVQTWDEIRLAVHDGGNGSRIITTTRKCEVARHVDTIYRLKPLSYVNSKNLFYKRIFGNKGIVPDNQYDEVSDRILKKCGGLPLAIITVASVLANKPREKWSEVYNAIVLKREGNRYIDNMRRVLSFSFYDLPSHLRACLLHLSTFPENCFIEKDFVIWMWVAEGFIHNIHNSRGLSMFDVGEKYFNDLVNRSMIQIAEECLNNGSVYGCRMHPVLFSHIRAISSEENFCTVSEDEHHISPGNNNSRRIAVHNVRNVEHSMEKVRSFNASLCFIDGMPQLSSFQVLRVLALEYCPGMSTNHLKMIGNLAHLRYLGLVGAGVLQFPEETLGGLRFLQTLDLRETDIEQWPRTISKLEHLMCLCVRRTRTLPEGMMSSLEDLRLHLVSSNSSNMATELIKMQKLRVLVLGFEEQDVELEKALVDSICKLPKIQRLEIYDCKPFMRAVLLLDHFGRIPKPWCGDPWRSLVVPPDLRQLVLGGLFFYRLPSWIHPLSLPYLSHLHLEVKVLEDGDLDTLARFPKLHCLVLMAAASGKQQHHISSDHAFNELNFFSTNMAVRLESGPGGPPMPNLEHIELYMLVAQCTDSRLSSLANLKSLEKVTVVLNCQGASIAETEEAEEKVRRATGIHPNRRLKLEVTKENGTDEVPLIEHFRFKNPRFEAMRSEMEKMQANRQVQIQPDNDSEEEIAPPAMAVSE